MNDEQRPPDLGVPSHVERESPMFMRRGAEIVEAFEEDVKVARGYRAWPDKGAAIDGRRLTLMTRSSRYACGEPIRVVHVAESTREGDFLYVAGPKPVFGEYLDDRLVGKPPENPEDPLVPLDYDGKMVPSPAFDANYDVTTYVFASPGTHTLRWKLGDLESNRLTLTIADCG